MTRSHFARVAVVALLAGSAQADVVLDWNSTYLDAIRLTGGPPCPISRVGAMLNLAIFDSVNSIDRTVDPGVGYNSYQSSLPAVPAFASREAAVAGAAHRIMTDAYSNSPATLAAIQTRYEAQLLAIPNGPAKAAGLAHGIAVANALIAHRANDGTQANPIYVPGGNAGDWRPSPDGPNVPGFTPHWGNTTPWALNSGGQFRPTRLTNYGTMANLLASDEYAQQINGGPGVPSVKELGDRNSASRTADQTEMAWFWANDRNGTSKPPGQLIQFTQQVSRDRNLSLSENARLFGLVGMAMGDAGVSAWDAKYNTAFDLWRPIDAIRETQDDGNAATTPDPNWLPLNDFTPPFPAHVSGHATFGAAHAAIMAAFFGTDNVTFTVGTDEFSVNPGLGYAADKTRTFTSFSQAAWENAMSRVYLGVHFYFDAVDGNRLGYDVGNFAFNNFLQPIPTPGTATLLALAGLAAGRRRR